MPQLRALVVRGGWTGHQPIESTDLIIPFLEAGGFVVQIEDSPEIYADGSVMAHTDLIVQCVTTSEISPEACPA